MGDLTRLQFILKTNLKYEDLYGNESLKMLINEGKEFPTKDVSQMRASGNINGGLIKTLNSKNKHFCMKEDCVYSVTILTRHINQITLFASSVNNGQTL